MSPSLRAFAFAFLAFRPHVAPVEWAEANLHLSALVTEAPGPYSTRLHPYVREPLDCFADNTVSDLVLCWGAQTAKTTTVAAGTLDRIANSPTPVLFVFPTTDNAQSFAESRLVPLFDSSEQLRGLKPKERDRFKKTEWLLSTCNVNLVGSNSPANVASRPIGLLICDETDKFSEGTAKEAGAIQLAVERTKAFQSAKRVYTSTPTTDSGQIWCLFLQGDQRYYHVPCPHCNELIRLEWENVQWDQDAKDPKTEIWDFARVQSTAHYVCQKCKGRITDAHKTKMLRGGRWIPSAVGLPGWRSYHLNSLYSASLTFGKLATKWLQAKHGSLSDLQNFINSTLAEPWRDRALTIKEEKLAPLLGTTERGTYDPSDGGHNLMSIDVQQGYFAWVVRRFYAGNRSHLVDWGMAPSYPDLDIVEARYGVKLVSIDSSEGSRAPEVYREVAQRGGRWVAIKGGVMSDFLRPVMIDPYTGSTKANQIKITLLHVSDPVFTDELLARLDGKIGGWKLTKEIDITYQRQILAVYKSEKRKRNGTIEVSIKSKGSEHLFDCEKHLLALASVLQLGRPTADNPTTGNGKPAREGAFEFAA